MSKRGHNEGSIYKRDDGRWVACITVGYLNGKRQRKSFYGETRNEVQKQLATALRSQQQNLPMASDRQTVGQYLHHWLVDSHKATIRAKTFATYSYIVNSHLIPGLGRIVLSRLSPQQLQQFMNAKLEEGLSARTVHHCHAVLRTALEEAVRWGLVGRNVAKLVKPPRPKRSDIQPLDPEQVRKLLETIRGHRLEALFTVALAVGLREGEALGLRWQDVDLDAGRISVRIALQRISGKLQFEEVKSATSRRHITLPLIAVEALRAHYLRQQQEQELLGERWPNTGLVFTSTRGTPLEPRNAVRLFQRMLQKAGLPHKRFYDLRHTCATLLLVQGVHPRVVMEILGHSQISLTMNTYSHVSPTLQREAASRMDDVLSPKTSKDQL
jgi:integrase